MKMKEYVNRTNRTRVPNGGGGGNICIKMESICFVNVKNNLNKEGLFSLAGKICKIQR